MSLTTVAQSLKTDARFALRGMLRRKVWTLSAALTLALGIGAATDVFTVVNALIWHPLFYVGAERVFELQLRPQSQVSSRLLLNPSRALVSAWMGSSHAFEDIEPIPASDALLAINGDEPLLVQSVRIQPSFFTFAGQRPILGRKFDGRDTVIGGQLDALIGERLWHRRFGTDPSVIGRTISVDGSLATIVGVAPASLRIPGERADEVGVWLPYRSDAASFFPVRVIGRLRLGISAQLASAELDSIASRSGVTSPLGRASATLTPLWQLVPFRTALKLLSGSVVLVLLLACGNVAHMLLARGATRRREFWIRTAIGATQSRLWSQLVVESGVLVLVGCGLGLLVAFIGLRAIALVRPASIPELDAARLVSNVWISATFFTAATGLIFGSLQTVAASGRLPADSVRSRITGSGRIRRLHALIFTEAAMAFIVLYAASNLVEGALRLETANPGFDTKNLIFARVRLTSGGAEFSPGLMDEFGRRVRTIPGVLGITFASQVPPDVGALRVQRTVEIEGESPPPNGAIPRIGYNRVASGFFSLARLDFVAGGGFTDTSAASGQVVLSAATARRLWPGRSAIGRRFRFDRTARWSEVVGVVADVAAGGLAPESREQVIYLPLPTHSVSVLLIRTNGTPGVASRIGQVFTSLGLGDRLPPPTVTSVEDALALSVARPAFAARILAVFANLCVLLTALGVYGVLSYAVEQRKKGIGIRLALGGTRGSIGRGVIAEALRPAAFGAAVGVAIIPLATPMLRATTQAAESADFRSAIVALLLVALTATVAAAMPAARAMRTDPIASLRME